MCVCLRAPIFEGRPMLLGRGYCLLCLVGSILSQYLYGSKNAALTRYEVFLVVQSRNRMMQHSTSP